MKERKTDRFVEKIIRIFLLPLSQNKELFISIKVFRIEQTKTWNETDFPIDWNRSKCIPLEFAEHVPISVNVNFPHRFMMLLFLFHSNNTRSIDWIWSASFCRGNHLRCKQLAYNSLDELKTFRGNMFRRFFFSSILWHIKMKTWRKEKNAKNDNFFRKQ